MDGEGKGFLQDLSYQVLIALIVLLIIALVAALRALGLPGLLLFGALVLLLGLALRFRPGLRWREWRERRADEKAAPWINRELLSYMAHLRDVNRSFWR